jgi:hypothetical protein
MCLVHDNNELLYILFFERTAQDSACFIDIAEKYKTMVLGGHRQEQEKKKNKSSPGWIETSTQVTTQLYTMAGRIGMSTRPKLYTHNNDRRDKTQPQLHPQIQVSKP